MSVPIAQWIVHISPEDGMAVRFRLGIHHLIILTVSLEGLTDRGLTSPSG